jgi:hypothetical protein
MGRAPPSGGRSRVLGRQPTLAGSILAMRFILDDSRRNQMARTWDPVFGLHLPPRGSLVFANLGPRYDSQAYGLSFRVLGREDRHANAEVRSID